MRRAVPNGWVPPVEASGVERIDRILPVVCFARSEPLLNDMIFIYVFIFT